MTERRRPQPLGLPEDPLLEALLEFGLDVERNYQARKRERKMRLHPIPGDRSRSSAA